MIRNTREKEIGIWKAGGRDYVGLEKKGRYWGWETEERGLD